MKRHTYGLDITMQSATLPTLAALQSFEAAARLGSFTKAAAERHLTHSAISRNIQAVEQWCGEKLFERRGPKVVLSPAGHLLSQRIGSPMQALRAALELDDTGTSARLPLKVFMLASMARTWLVARLPTFDSAYPHISLAIETGYDMVSLPPHVPAVAIRFGHFARTGLHCQRLWFDYMVAVAAPKWLTQHGHQPGQWPAHQLLRHTHEPWPHRLPKCDLLGQTRLPSASGHEFNDALLLIDAAVHGCGIAWVRASLARPFVTEGALVVLTQAQQLSDKAAWLVCREDMTELPQVRDFFTWATEVAGQSPLPTARL